VIGNVAADTQFRHQDAPRQTAAVDLYRREAASEYSLPHRVTWSSNKASEVNALNIPLTPAMVVRVYPGLTRPAQTYKILSRPITMFMGGANI